MRTPDDFGLIVIGDEILRGKRRDRHFDGIRALLAERGFNLAWFQILPDEPALLTLRLRSSMLEGRPVFCCGGIGATPDDHTRACAAAAAGVMLQRHAGAVAQIESRFGAEAYPTRIRMADLPVGSELIPNPYNRIPGFAIRQHYFLPGFPDMAHPMAAWVLDNWHGTAPEPECERSLRVFDVTESRLVELMERLAREHPGVKLFSLPRLGEDGFVELGFRGRGDVEPAFVALCEGLRAAGLAFQELGIGGDEGERAGA